MAEPGLVLVTGAGGGVGGVGGKIFTRPADVATALDSVQRMFFSMSLAPSYLEASATVATVARAVGDLDALVAISQMTVSQMGAAVGNGACGQGREQRTVQEDSRANVYDGKPRPVKHLLR
jgi:hypothetical protein